MQNTKNRQDENDLQSKDVTSGELSTKSAKAVTEKRCRGKEIRLNGNKTRESGSRGYQQGETKFGDKRDRTVAEVRNRKTADKRDFFSGGTRTRDRRQPESEEQLQHLENGNLKSLRDHKDLCEDQVNNHHRWS